VLPAVPDAGETVIQPLPFSILTAAVQDTEPLKLAICKARRAEGVPGTAEKLSDEGLTLSSGPAAAPACVTVNVRPAIVNVPVREAEPLLAATENATVPPPLPLLPEVIVTKPELLAAVHAQPLPAVTLALPDPPLEGKD
jgi:hypothetical protein